MAMDFLIIGLIYASLSFMLVISLVLRWFPLLLLAGAGFLMLGITITDVTVQHDIEYLPAVYGNVTSSDFEETDSYSWNGTSGGSDVNSATRTIAAEYASTGSSVLVGDTVNCIAIPLSKVGTPSSANDIILGVFNSTGGAVYTFGIQDETALTTSVVTHTYCNSGSTYTIQNGDRIGAKFVLADGTNRVQLRADSLASFDGTTTHFQSFASGSWTSTTGTDINARIYLRENVTSTFVELLENEHWIEHETTAEFPSIFRIISGFGGSLIILAAAILFLKDD